MDSKKTVETKKNLLVFHFGSYYNGWKAEEVNDDRLLFCNMYDQLNDALDAMAKMKNNFVWSAFNKESKEQEKQMCEIVKRFTGSYPVYGRNSVYDPNQF